jgi:DNA polymerase elongation subunit (family B)
MIVNYEYLNGRLAISYINKKGNIEFKNLPWNNPLEWSLCSDKDPQKSEKFSTWDKKPVKLRNARYPNRYAIYEFMQKLPKEQRDEIFAYNEPKLFFCDIEVEITDGFPEAHIANNKVTAICLIFKNRVLLLGIKELDSPEWIPRMEKEMNEHFKSFNTNYKIEWMCFDSEYEMLSYFFNDLIKVIPVLTGWNFVGYDWVYFVTRARKLGINPNVASPTGKLIKPWKKQDKNAEIQKPTFEELPIHRLVFDYMDIFDKWDTSIKIKENNTLDFVSQKVLGVKKLEYDGSLKDLQHKDYYKYLLYNCIDTALVQLIHEKQRTFDLMMAISNLANIPMENALSAIRVTEGILFQKYYDIGIVMVKQSAPVTENGDDDEDEVEELAGGYVKYPSIGIKRWVNVFDFASLYPTTMRQFNIAPESFKGLKISPTESLLNGIRYTIDPTDIVLLNGAVFKNEESETKKVLTSIFTDRKSNKNMGLDHRHQGALIKKYYEQRFKKKTT